MREDRRFFADSASEAGEADDNVVTLPNLMSGRLADLLAAASGAGQTHELRGELSARATFQAVSATWPSRRRKLRRTPAVLAVTTVATMMVATTGLAAATELPGSAGRAVQGIFGSVGVNLTSPSPSGSGAGAGAGSGSGATVSGGNHSLGLTRPGCTVGGTAVSGASGVRTTSCTITVPRPGSTSVSTTPSAPTVHTSNHAPAPAAASTFRAPRNPQHGGGHTSTVQGTGVTPGGGGSSRGGNDGGSGSCGTTTTTTTTTTTLPPAGDSSADTTTTTTDPDATTSGCGHSGGHHHTTTTTTTTTTTP